MGISNVTRFLDYPPHVLARLRRKLFRHFPALDPDVCWLWPGYIGKKGYGTWTVWYKGHSKTRVAHAVSYILLRGPIPPFLELDHLCRNRACTNPWHLEPVPHLLNAQRGIAGTYAHNGAWQRAKTHCRRGHPFDAVNTYVHGEHGTWRRCRICNCEDARRYRNQRRISNANA
jgi:HNH endonuclease